MARENGEEADGDLSRASASERRATGRRVLPLLLLLVAALASVPLGCMLALSLLPWKSLGELRQEAILRPPPASVEVSREEYAPNPVAFMPPQGSVKVVYASTWDVPELARWYEAEFRGKYDLAGSGADTAKTVQLGAVAEDPRRGVVASIYSVDSGSLPQGYKSPKAPRGTKAYVVVGVSNLK